MEKQNRISLSSALPLLFFAALLTPIVYVGFSAPVYSTETGSCGPTAAANTGMGQEAPVIQVQKSGATITIRTDKQAYSKTDWMNITIATQIDRTAFRWQGYLIEVSTLRYPDGTVKVMGLGGLGYSNQTELTMSNLRDTHAGKLPSALPIGTHTMTTRLIQFVGINVPHRGPDPDKLTALVRATLEALVPQALSPGTNARVLLEANAQFSVGNTSSTVLTTPSNLLAIPVLSAVMTTVTAADGQNTRKRALAALLAALSMTVVSMLPMVVADNVGCGSSATGAQGWVSVQTSGNRPDGVRFSDGTYSHSGHLSSGYCWQVSPTDPNYSDYEYDYYFAQQTNSWTLAGSYFHNRDCNTIDWSFGAPTYQFSSSAQVTQIRGYTYGYYKQQGTGSLSNLGVFCSAP